MLTRLGLDLLRGRGGRLCKNLPHMNTLHNNGSEDLSDSACCKTPELHGYRKRLARSPSLRVP